MKAMKKIFVILALFMAIGQIEFVQAGEDAGTDHKKKGYIVAGLAAAIAAGYGIYHYFFKDKTARFTVFIENPEAGQKDNFEMKTDKTGHTSYKDIKKEVEKLYPNFTIREHSSTSFIPPKQFGVQINLLKKTTQSHRSETTQSHKPTKTHLLVEYIKQDKSGKKTTFPTNTRDYFKIDAYKDKNGKYIATGKDLWKPIEENIKELEEAFDISEDYKDDLKNFQLLRSGLDYKNSDEEYKFDRGYLKFHIILVTPD